MMKELTRTARATYSVVFEQADGAEMQFEFQVTTDPIPAVVWSDEFEELVGTLSGPAPELLDLILRFHHVCNREVTMRRA